MKSFMIAIGLLLALGACAQQSSEQSGDTANDTAASTETHSTPAAGESQSEASAASLEISGNLGCGHCNHGIGESCSAAVQTADGTVYILEGMGEGSEPYDQRFSGGSITVAGTVAERDGVKYITVDSFTM